MKKLLFILVALLVVATPVTAADFTDGTESEILDIPGLQMLSEMVSTVYHIELLLV